MILGIDVGLTGAVAVLTDEGVAVEVFDLPVMASGKHVARVSKQINAGVLAMALRHRQEDRALGDLLAFVERQQAMPAQGVSSVFSLGHSYGKVCGVLAALAIPYILVSPRAWKKHFALGKDKGEALTLARKTFPTMELHLKKHHNRAEALLIAAYGVVRNKGGC